MILRDNREREPLCPPIDATIPCASSVSSRPTGRSHGASQNEYFNGLLEGAQRETPTHRKFTAEETEALVDIYRDHVLPMNLGSDAIGYSEEIIDLVAREFAMRIGKHVPGHELNSKLTRLRKRGELPKLGNQEPGTDEGFRDLDAI